MYCSQTGYDQCKAFGPLVAKSDCEEMLGQVAELALDIPT
jgi:hypothetical protein